MTGCKFSKETKGTGTVVRTDFRELGDGITHAEDLSEGGEHAQTPKESAGLGAALSRAPENTNCEALQRGGAISGEGGNARDPSENERRRRNVQRDQTVRYDIEEE
jgi:hypothetical protein